MHQLILQKKLKAAFEKLSMHLPNPHTSRVDLFCNNARPSQRFLVCLVAVNFSPGINESQNREKALITHILRSHFNCCSDLLLLGGCICYSISRNAVGAVQGTHTHTQKSSGHGRQGSANGSSSQQRVLSRGLRTRA